MRLSSVYILSIVRVCFVSSMYGSAKHVNKTIAYLPLLILIILMSN